MEKEEDQRINVVDITSHGSYVWVGNGEAISISTDSEVFRQSSPLADDDTSPSTSAELDGSGSGGDDGGMDRIDSLERAVTRLEGDIGSLRADFGGMRNDMSEIRIALADLNSKLNIGEIRANVERAHTDIYKWVATIAISVAGLGFAIYAGLKSTAQPQQQQPTVQYVVPTPQAVTPPAAAVAPPVPQQPASHP